MVFLNTDGPSAGASGLNVVLVPTSRLVVTVEAARPFTRVLSGPVTPGRTWNCFEPLVPLSLRSSGADTGAARNAIGLRTVWPRRSDQVSEPNDHWPNA